MDLFLIVGPAGMHTPRGQDPFDPALACVIAIGLARCVGCPTAEARNYCIVACNQAWEPLKDQRRLVFMGEVSIDCSSPNQR